MKDFFDNVRLVPNMTINAITGQRNTLIETEYRCSKCGKWFDKNGIANYSIPVSSGNVPEIQKVEFVCNACNEKQK